MRNRPRLVAVKLLSHPTAMETGRFDREIAVLRHLSVPGIVHCLESGESNDARYYIMDFVDGIHLDEYLAGSGLDLRDKMPVFCKVCLAVSGAHQAGVVHRDLKPRNILVDVEGQPHILDFGICSVFSADWTSWNQATLTLPGDVIGTVKYMSPEQAWGGAAGQVDHRTDLWALGIMLFELVTDGQYPYSLSSMPDRSAPEALLERIRRDLPRKPSLDHLPHGRDLETLLSRCLAWEPGQRLSSVADLADDLGRWCRGERMTTRPLSIPYRAHRLLTGAALRSRGTLHVLSVAAVAVILSIIPLVFDVGWETRADDLVLSDQREHRVDSINPSPVDASVAPAGPLDSSVEPPPPTHRPVEDLVRIIGVTDETGRFVVSYAQVHELPGVTHDVRTWRGVHARLLDRIGTAKPRAIVWDYYFHTPQSQDAELAAVINRLEGEGTPVVLAALSYDQHGRPELSREITAPLGRKLRHGAILARDMVQRPGDVVLALGRPDGQVIPGIALTALASLMYPDARLELDWPERTRDLEMLFETADGAYKRDHHRLPNIKTFASQQDQLGVRPGDLLACGSFQVHRPEYWVRRLAPYETYLSMEAEPMSDQLRGTVVIIGDLRTTAATDRPDRYPVRIDQVVIDDVPGCFLLADGVTGLISGRLRRRVYFWPPAYFALSLGMAVLGCLVPAWIASTDRPVVRPRVRTFTVIPVALAMLCGIILVRSDERALVLVAATGVAVLVPVSISFWIERARNRHRLLEARHYRGRQLGSMVDGTKTVKLPPARPHPGAQ